MCSRSCGVVGGHGGGNAGGGGGRGGSRGRNLDTRETDVAEERIIIPSNCPRPSSIYLFAKARSVPGLRAEADALLAGPMLGFSGKVRLFLKLISSAIYNCLANLTFVYRTCGINRNVALQLIRKAINVR
jgi:hypothetical protein